MSENGTPPQVAQVVVTQDGFKTNIGTNGIPLDVTEKILLGALAWVQREIIVARLLQAEALREQAKPRVMLPGAPI